MARAPKFTDQEMQHHCEQAFTLAQKTRKAIEKQETERVLQFKRTFTVFETCYKSLLSAYLKKQNKPATQKSLVFQKQQAAAVMRSLGIVMDDKDFHTAFSGESEKGKRGARGLRNALQHHPTAQDYEELNSKYEETMSALNAFLVAVGNKACEEEK